MAKFFSGGRKPKPKAATPEPKDDSAERGVSSARQRALSAAVDAEEARASTIEPLPQGDRQWVAASAPEQPWKPSPGIEVMNGWFPGSHPLTREKPPPPRIKVTMQQARQIKFQMYGNQMMAPWMKREFAEVYEIVDAPKEPMPIPESVDHHDGILARLKAAAAAFINPQPKVPGQPKAAPPKPRQGTTWFS